MGSALKWVVIILLAPVLVVVFFVVSLISIGSIIPDALDVSCGQVGNIVAPRASVRVSASSLDPEQLENARLIVSIGHNRGLSKRYIQIALQTGYQESRLRNLDHGHLDSLGLFQQRPSAGWGTARDITTPVYAINKFYEALEKVENRDELSPFEVAMEVQIPSRRAYLSPDNNWNSWAPLAEELINSAQLPNPQAPVNPMVYEEACSRNTLGSSSENADSNTSGWQRPLDSMNVGSEYGQRFHPIRRVWSLHDGTDFPARTGTPIYSISSGTVVARGYNPAKGNYVEVNYGGGQIVTYMHMSRQASVFTGQFVESGKIVGFVGSTGYSTGPHLHLSWYSRGEPVDPIPQLCQRGITIAGPKGCAKVG